MEKRVDKTYLYTHKVYDKESLEGEIFIKVLDNGFVDLRSFPRVQASIEVFIDMVKGLNEITEDIKKEFSYEEST